MEEMIFCKELRQTWTPASLGQHLNCDGVSIEVAVDRYGEFHGYELLCNCGEPFIVETID
jgi:hypothetical protein